MRVEMEQRGRELNSFKEIVKKAVNAKAKAAQASLLCLRHQSTLFLG